MHVKENNKLFCRNVFFNLSEGALLNTLKLFCCKMKSECKFFLCFTVKMTFFFTTSGHCFGKNLELVLNKFFMNVEKKIIQLFAERKFYCVQ